MRNLLNYQLFALQNPVSLLTTDTLVIATIERMKNFDQSRGVLFDETTEKYFKDKGTEVIIYSIKENRRYTLEEALNIAYVLSAYDVVNGKASIDDYYPEYKDSIQTVIDNYTLFDNGVFVYNGKVLKETDGFILVDGKVFPKTYVGSMMTWSVIEKNPKSKTLKELVNKMTNEKLKTELLKLENSENLIISVSEYLTNEYLYEIIEEKDFKLSPDYLYKKMWV